MFGLVATKRSVDAVSGYSRVSKVYLKVQKRKVANKDERIWTKNLTKFVIITIPPAGKSNRDLGEVSDSFYEEFFFQELDYEVQKYMLLPLLEEAGNFWR